MFAAYVQNVNAECCKQTKIIFTPAESVKDCDIIPGGHGLRRICQIDVCADGKLAPDQCGTNCNFHACFCDEGSCTQPEISGSPLDNFKHHYGHLLESAVEGDTDPI